MTKDEALRNFRETVLPYIRQRYEQDRIDHVARRIAWNDYVDALHRDGLITDKQANWTYNKGK